MIHFDRLLYRILTGSWGRFTFFPGPVLPGDVSATVDALATGEVAAGGAPDTSGAPATIHTTIPDPVGFYAHIPFCRSLCPFCPYTKVLYEEELAMRYLSCLKSEAERVLSSLGDARVSSIYFGGGTPLLLPEAVQSLVRLIRPRLAENAEVAVEVHPSDVTPSVLCHLADVGVNMVSLGAESLDDEVLRSLGRSHDSAGALAALNVLMDSGRFSVNVDLITAIPGQSLESTASDMLRLLKCGVDQVSAYPLMDFSFTRMRSRLSLRGQRRLLDTLADMGSRFGYERSSVWTWTKPGAPKYTSITRENYVGIGAGAASRLDRRFWVNTFSVDDYVEAIAHGKTAVALSTMMSSRESALYRLFWQCYEGGFDLQSFQDPEAGAIPALQHLVGVAERSGLVTRECSTVHLTDNGLFLYHLLERYYTRRYIGRLWQSCRESAFPQGLTL